MQAVQDEYRRFMILSRAEEHFTPFLLWYGLFTDLLNGYSPRRGGWVAAGKFSLLSAQESLIEKKTVDKKAA